MYFLFCIFRDINQHSSECSNGLILTAHFSGPSSPFPKGKLDFLENCSWEVSEKALPLHSACNYIFDKKETFPNPHQRGVKTKENMSKVSIEKKSVGKRPPLPLFSLTHYTRGPASNGNLPISTDFNKRHPVCYSCVAL